LLTHLQRIKKKISQAKSVFRSAKTGATNLQGFTSDRLTKAERKLLMEKYLPKRVRPNGFRAFTNSEDFRDNELGKLIEVKMEELRKEKGDPDHQFSSREYFRLTEDIKNSAWRSLSEAEKGEWRMAAKRTADGGGDADKITQ
jgi:hypothetical protein